MRGGWGRTGKGFERGGAGVLGELATTSVYFVGRVSDHVCLFCWES